MVREEFKYDYDLEELQLITPKNRDFQMLVAPRYIDHYCNNAYEDFTSDLLLSLSQDNMLFIDIGASYGYYTILVGTKHPNCKIAAFEPVPENFEVLKRNIALNQLKNVELNNSAVSNDNGVRKFKVTEASDSGGFYDHPLAKTLKEIEVQAICLDDFLKETLKVPTIIKIDAEGHEPYVLQGMKRLLKDAEDIKLIIELTPACLRNAGYAPEEFLEEISRLGFDIYAIDDKKRMTYKIAPASFGRYLEYLPDSDKTAYANILCLKERNSLSVCFFSHSAQLAGAELSLLELVTELVKGHGVVCSVILPSDGPLRERLSQVGAATHIARYSWWWNSRAFPEEHIDALCTNSSKSVLYTIKQVLSKINPDIIFTNTMVIPWGAIASSLLGKPHVWFIREFGDLGHGLKPFLPLDVTLESIKNLSALILTNSDAVRKALFGEANKEILTVYQHINIPSTALQQEDDVPFIRANSTKLIISGSVQEGKGQRDAILAVKELVAAGRDAELVIMGPCSTNYAQDLKKIVREAELEEHIRFVGFIKNPYPIVNRADIVLVCSRNEAFGRVTVEGMLLKKPVIGTNTGGTPELIRDGFNGLLYEPGDHKQLAAKVEYLTDHREEARQMGEKGHEFARDTFTKSEFGGKIYKLLLNLKRKPASQAVSSSFTLKGPAILDALLTTAPIRNPKIVALLTELGSSLFTGDARIANLEASLREKTSQINRLEAHAHRLESQIQEIHHSIPMQLVNRYQRIVQRLLPSGTLPRRHYELGIAGIRVILNEGWHSFFAKFKEWLLRNMHRPFRFLCGWGALQFSRVANVLLSWYQRLVPSRIKAMVPNRLKDAVKRQILAKLPPITADVPKASADGLYEDWNRQMVSANAVAPFDEAVFGPQLLRDWSEKSEILRALYAKGDDVLEQVPPETRKMAQAVLARNALRVSVVMPTCNREKVIANAVLSALNQSYPPTEVIVVDDGSEDKTCELLEEQFADQIASGQLRILRRAHQGVSPARNAGLASASGDLIAYLDSDDTWYQDYLLIMAAIFAECDELATAYAALRCHVLDEQRTFIRATRYDRRTLLEQNFIGMNVFMHRRFVYLQNGGFDESLRRLVDWDLVTSYTRLYPPAFVPLIGSDQYIDGNRLGNITKTVDLDHNRRLVYRKHLAERIRHGLEGLRLAYVLWNWPALSETFVVNEVRWLIQQGQDVKVYYKADPEPAAQLDFKVDAYRVRDAEHLAELLIAHGRTFCHTHFAYPTTTLLTWPACEATGLPFTFFAHAVDIFHQDNRKRNRIDDVVRSANCKRVFVYGEHHKAFLEEQGVPCDKIGLNFQAVALDLYEQIPPVEHEGEEGMVRGIFIGRFVEKKGADILLEAAAILRDKPITFELYGYGPLEKRCHQRAVALGLDNVKFMGPIEHAQDMVRIFESADFLIVPSIVASNGDTEGFPTVILEAMAAGCPVIVSSVSAIPDFLRDMVEAILVEPKNPEALASGILRLLAMTPERRAAMNFEARRFLEERVGVDKTMQVYLDTWRNNPVDIFLVTFNTSRYNHRDEAMEIIERVMQHTTTPYTLTIVDNGSDYEFRKMLVEIAKDQPQIRLIFKEKNLFCGPASNIALEHGDALLAIYLCSNEAFISHHGWERPLIDHMREHPEEMLAGTRVHLPKYTLGRELLAYPDFGKFRNPEFASQHPDRPFTHVQGGAFILRRGAIALYGGFSPAMPQGGMDVEFSYFLESLGARLGNVPQLVSVTTKAIPGLSARVDEFTSVAHPLTLDTVHSILDEFRDTVSGICNICGELLGQPASGEMVSEQCTKCGSTPFGRTIYQRLANDWRTHRGGRAVLVTSDRALGSVLGERMFHLTHAPGSLEAACTEVVKAQETMDLVVIDPDCVRDKLEYLWDAALSALRPGGLLLYADGRVEAFVPNAIPPALLAAALNKRGWSVRPSFPEARLSRTLWLDWRRLFEVEGFPSPRQPRLNQVGIRKRRVR